MTDQDYRDLQSPQGGYGGIQQPGALYVRKGGTGGKAGAKSNKPKLKTPKNGEVTILADFVWKPPISGAKEIQLLVAGQWHPGFADYAEITDVKTKESPGNMIALLGAITEYKQQSIKRLNFFTHANLSVVGIRGFINPENVYFDESVDAADVDGLTRASLNFTYKNQNFTLDDVRSRFTEDAIFVLYGCDTAFAPTVLLTAWKDLFQVTTIGFKTEMMFCPPRQTIGGREFKRKGEKIGIWKPNFTCDVNSTRNWRSLIDDPSAVKVSK
ncbi:hypothetical protein ARTSIC4J27_2196 [Pseudarthrobacter siccitolerans]|uniref:Uncharacterized protein n=1 Tax=Pseudarthrobacter siccitolerans TaxID=861266 RepID=A0A024H3C0_9MICC|nr:hypothetical protein [Pseudarthrobacter siccitolerans]CCQ46236.1 hypothetical protein ARTSIC4J27_2196 [Pseudarthrobacter siccitolerans]